MIQIFGFGSNHDPTLICRAATVYVFASEKTNFEGFCVLLIFQIFRFESNQMLMGAESNAKGIPKIVKLNTAFKIVRKN